MKKLIFLLVVACGIPCVLAQGTVVFSNRSGGGTSHVWFDASGGGTIIHGNSSIDVPAGTTVYPGYHLIGANGLVEAQHTFAQLLGAPGSGAAESSLLPGSPTTTFRTGGGAGNVVPTTATFNNIPPDAPVATFEMVVWDNSTGFYPTWAQAAVAWQSGLIQAGTSAPFVLQNIGGPTFTPPNLNPALQSFGFGVPEPSLVALLTLAANLLIYRSRNRN